ncbi:TPR repeat-containing protein [Tolypothrix tenuis PCC 7101]|uniref:TPR repeat-containing protein n=1 Tax=Tolypothrix tenuis PCC 7101 TaxID=231146 RepID=A0A1Z4N8L8_9CYAN|nr:CHAT domain-containing protein [Aulosira sp. FACHB-113]BAZ02076.1 TPR repeat-containing protein [Tolypothrix tenuis PCC 7101]BAZ74001.1 TPR repeat-containing protein [Aulosira laxa NIES-50]
MRRSLYRPIAQPLQRLTLTSLALYLIFPLGALELVPLRTSQVLAQSANARKTEADRLLKQGNELFDSDQNQAALKLFQQTLGIYRQIKDRQGESTALRKIGTVYDYLGEFKQAITYYKQALDIAEAINDTDSTSRVLSNWGLAYLHLGNTQRTNEYCQKALAVAQESQNYETEALALKCISAFYLTTQSLDKGIDFIGQALEAIRKANGTPNDKLRQRQLEISLLNSRSDLYHALGTYKLVNKDKTGYQLLNQSLQDRQQALTIAKQIGDTRRQGKALLGMGDTYSIQNQYSKAVETFKQALQLFQSDKNSRSQLRETYTKLGDAYKEWDKKEQGLISYQEALKIIKTEVPNSRGDKLFQDTDQGWLLVNIGNIYFDTTEYEKAVNSYEDALKILLSSLAQVKKTTNPITKTKETVINNGIQLSYLRMCLAYKFLGRYEEGNKACQAAGNAKEGSNNSNLLKNLSSDKLKSTHSTKSPEKIAKAEKDLKEAEESLEQARAFQNTSLEAYALAKIGNAYTDLGNYQEAETYFKQAIELSKSVESSQYKPVIFFLAGEFYRKQKKYDEAIQYYKQGGDYAKETGYQLQEANIFAQSGITSYLANKLPEATNALYRAVNVFDAMRDKLVIDGNRIAIFETQARYYSLLQKVLIDQKKFSEALEIAERSRARAFINLLASRLSAKSNDKLTTNLSQISSPKIQQLQKIAKQQNATIVEYAVPNPPNYDDGTHDEDQLVWDGAEIYIWVVKPTGEVAFKLQKLNTPLKDLVAASRRAIGVYDNRGIVEPVNPVNDKIQLEDVEKLYQKLYQLLIQPIAQYLPKNPNERVIFIPQNELFLVAFPALKDEQNKYLIEKHTVLTAPAIQVLELTHQQRQKVAGNGALVVGNPNMPSITLKKGEAPEKLNPLKNAEKEAREIAQILNTKSLVGNQATKSTVKQQMVNARIIHLATHGLLNDFGFGVPGAIALAPDNLPKGEKKENNGLLTASEIFDMKLKAELVVLSACQTGQGDIKGDGVIGLSRSLIAAGVPSVVVSLWSVPDDSTKLLMTEFYRQMQQTSDKAQALRQAMLITMKQYPDPRAWAGFTLIGESL